MPYGTIYSDTVQGSVAATAPVFRDGNSVEIGQICKSWVNFNGVSGSVAVRASFNTSSVTRGSAGLYLVAFTVSMTDSQHATNANAQPNNYSGAYAGSGDTAAGTQTSGRASIENRDTNNASADSNYLHVSVHR
jgi:hypothetical protein